jgi:sigma-B regulation protein RsbU (phosphoserine phosphatase)
MNGPDNAHQQHITVMAGPLSSGDRRLGVLVVTADSQAQEFSENDFEVFNSLVEQSAFALANARAHQEVQTKRQLEAELHTAGEVQRILLPTSEPTLDGYTIAGRNRPARILSGDFYDYVRVDASHFGAVIADVSGKGFPAALIAATTRAALQAHALGKLSPASVLSAVNRQVSEDIRGDTFISMIYLIFEQGSPHITLARAGHPNPLIWRRATGTVEKVESGGMGVGIDDGDTFERVTKDTTATLNSGDLMLLYTDGVKEAIDGKEEEFGSERLSQVFREAAVFGAEEVVIAVQRGLKLFTGEAPQMDDITLVAIEKR